MQVVEDVHHEAQVLSRDGVQRGLSLGGGLRHDGDLASLMGNDSPTVEDGMPTVGCSLLPKRRVNVGDRVG